jgi:hypothetical protein
MDARQLVFRRERRVTLDDAPGSGDSAAVARQLDAVLMTAGFKCSGALLAALSGLDPGFAFRRAAEVAGWARELAGDHVRHNAYFIDFPRNIPDTEEFWAQCLREAVMAGAQVRGGLAVSTLTTEARFVIDLLSLPAYGRYQHAYEEMLARHAELEPLLSDRMTVIHPGGALAAELAALFEELAGSAVPLSGQGLDDLRFLADACTGRMLPAVPVRENLAVINAVRVRAGIAPAVTTATDVLRLAAELSGSDVTLARPPEFSSLPRAQRRLLMEALDGTMSVQDSTRIADVLRYPEEWKRLFERLHPHEYPAYPGAGAAADVARRETSIRTLAGQAEEAFRNGNVTTAVSRLTAAPGMLWRSADRVLRSARPRDLDEIARCFEMTAPQVSGRVLLSVREHLVNRVRPGVTPRVFAGRHGRAWVTPDTRAPLDAGAVQALAGLIDAEITRRLPDTRYLVTDSCIGGAAVPLSGKPAGEGLGVWPRGSVIPVDGTLLRFFMYWRQRSTRTDFDLSCLFTDRDFSSSHHVSYTSLTAHGVVHSGDITDAPAPDGATEFIDVDLRLQDGYILPQVYVFAGEGFGEVAENFFGFMTREPEQHGRPFEARTVRVKSALAGDGRTAMPLAFFRGDDGRWHAKWLHLYLSGRASAWGGYRVEENKFSVQLLARSVLAREYLRVQYLAGCWQAKGAEVQAEADARVPAGESAVYLGAARPEGLPENWTAYTLENLGSLIPA